MRDGEVLAILTKSTTRVRVSCHSRIQQRQYVEVIIESTPDVDPTRNYTQEVESELLVSDHNQARAHLIDVLSDVECSPIGRGGYYKRHHGWSFPFLLSAC